LDLTALSFKLFEKWYDKDSMAVADKIIYKGFADEPFIGRRLYLRASPRRESS
jgi:hypothetical protein